MKARERNLKRKTFSNFYYSNNIRDISLKEIILHHFAQREVEDTDLIHEFCEMHYGSSWDVIVEFEGFCFDQPERKMPDWIDQFLEKKENYIRK